jgi:hypothetical protein
MACGSIIWKVEAATITNAGELNPQRLAGMFLRVLRLRFGEIARRVCHKLCQGRHAAEAIGLALKTARLQSSRSVRPCSLQAVHMLPYSPVTAKAAVM